MALTRVNNQALTNVTSAGIPQRTGAVLQTKHVVMKGIQRNTTTGSYTLVSDGTDNLQLTITPTSTSSKILIMTNINSHAHNAQGGGFIVVRGSTYNASNRITPPTGFGSRTPTNVGDAYTGDGTGDDRMMMNISSVLLDSPATTSAVTYSVFSTGITNSQGGTSINAASTDGDTDGSDYSRAVSTFTLMEIAG